MSVSDDGTGNKGARDPAPDQGMKIGVILGLWQFGKRGCSPQIAARRHVAPEDVRYLGDAAGGSVGFIVGVQPLTKVLHRISQTCRETLCSPRHPDGKIGLHRSEKGGEPVGAYRNRVAGKPDDVTTDPRRRTGVMRPCVVERSGGVSDETRPEISHDLRRTVRGSIVHHDSFNAARNARLRRYRGQGAFQVVSLVFGDDHNGRRYHQVVCLVVATP